VQTVEVSRTSYLRSWREVDVPTAALTLPDVTLLGGDVNQDDHIEQFDAMSMGLAWNATPESPQWDERADITDDGTVNILDMVAVQFNWDAVAPGPWAPVGAQGSHTTQYRGEGMDSLWSAPTPSSGDGGLQRFVPEQDAERAGGSTLVSAGRVAVGGSGEAFDLDIRVEDVSRLYGGRIQLAFDPGVVQVRDGDPGESVPGVQVLAGGWLDSDHRFELVNAVDNEAGTIDFAVTQLHPAQARSGSGVLITVPFVAVGKGSTSLRLVKVRLGDDTRPDPLVIPVRTQDGLVTVGRQRAIYLPWLSR
jgi:hypothetical protein